MDARLAVDPVIVRAEVRPLDAGPMAHRSVEQRLWGQLDTQLKGVLEGALANVHRRNVIATLSSLAYEFSTNGKGRADDVAMFQSRGRATRNPLKNNEANQWNRGRVAFDKWSEALAEAPSKLREGLALAKHGEDGLSIGDLVEKVRAEPKLFSMVAHFPELAELDAKLFANDQKLVKLANDRAASPPDFTRMSAPQLARTLDSLILSVEALLDDEGPATNDTEVTRDAATLESTSGSKSGLVFEHPFEATTEGSAHESDVFRVPDPKGARQYSINLLPNTKELSPFIMSLGGIRLRDGQSAMTAGQAAYASALLLEAKHAYDALAVATPNAKPAFGDWLNSKLKIQRPVADGTFFPLDSDRFTNLEGLIRNRGLLSNTPEQMENGLLARFPPAVPGTHDDFVPGEG